MLPETRHSNPIAPQWMYPDWGYSPWCETEHTYCFGANGLANNAGPLVVPVAGLAGQKFQFDFDSEFHITDWYVLALNQDIANTQIEVRLVDANGKRRINNFIPAVHANAFIPRDWVVLPGGTQRIDIRNLVGESVSLYVVFRGRKRFQYSQCLPIPAGFGSVEYVPLWARYSTAPEGYADEGFVYSFPAWNVTVAPFNAQIENVPFVLDTDAPFFLRTASLNVTNSDGATSYAARLIDPYGNRKVLNVNASTVITPYARETNFGGATIVSTLGRTFYPEIVCPAGSILGLDLKFAVSAGTSTGTLRVQGVKRQKV